MMIGGDLLAAVMIPILLIVGIVIILVVGKDASLSERRWARAILAPEVERGTMTDVELDVVAGTRKDRRRFVKGAKKANGRHAKRVAKHVLTAGRDLCEAVGRSGGQDTESVEVARQELVRVRGG
jgi:protease PrsW